MVVDLVQIRHVFSPARGRWVYVVMAERKLYIVNCTVTLKAILELDVPPGEEHFELIRGKLGRAASMVVERLEQVKRSVEAARRVLGENVDVRLVVGDDYVYEVLKGVEPPPDIHALVVCS